MKDLGKIPEVGEQFIQIAMICLGIVILTTDIFLPLGFVIWILYFVPLLMSVWLSWRYAPFVVAFLITGAILGSSLISGMYRQDPSDPSNRAIFILMIAIVSLLVWEIRCNYVLLEAEVIERRKAQKNLEELTIGLEERIAKRTRELSEANLHMTEDIEKRRRVELALGSANNKLSLLSQITRHDISNRIFALLAEIDLAKDLSNEPRLRESLEHLERTSMAIQDQIEFTRDYQEIGSQAPAWYEVGAIARSAADQLDSPDVTVQVDCNAVEIFTDAMIGKVFYNLINNALRHGEHVTRITISCSRKGDDLIISCEDNGIGIAQQNKEHIFRKGFGIDSGLGLFLIREILSITGITIRETGEPGKGARFEILVPRDMFRRREELQ
ncbi:MAG: sensor histidine kinase [Methanoregula sp.]